MRHDLRDQSRDPAKVNHKQAPSLPVGRYCLHPNLTSGVPPDAVRIESNQAFQCIHVKDSQTLI
jgi:hypothetical protein